MNAKDKNGKTVLMYAATGRHLEALRFLIDKGADVNAKDKNGKTALSLASANMYPEIVQYLKARGAK